MNLLGLPSVVQKRVLGQLEFPEFLLLSLTSTKAFRVMRSAGLHKTGVTFYFTWSSASDRFVIVISKKKENAILRWCSTLDARLIYQVVLNGKNYVGSFYGLHRNEHNTIHDIHAFKEPVELLQLVYSHLVELLRVHVDLGCRINPHKKSKFTFLRSINLNFDYVRFVERHISSVNLEKFLNQRRTPKSFTIRTRVYPSLRNNSKLLEVDNLNLIDAPFIRGVHLLNLRCSLACFWRTTLRDEDLIQFVNKWKEDTSDKLICLFIAMGTGFQLSPESIYEGVGAERWNPEQRPALFDMDKLKTIDKAFYERLEPDQSNGRDVRGRSGLIGTLSLTRNTFSFLVWH